MTATPLAVQHGIVKQILSGDAVVIRGQPRGGPPPERTLCLSNVTAPRLARRANPNFQGSQETKDEAFAWEAREFLRKKLIGKEVVFTVEYKAPGTEREYGCIYLGKDTTGENMTELIIAEGLVEVRRGGIKPGDEAQQRLIQLEEAAKAAGRGKWSEGAIDHVREIIWMLDNPRNFVDSFHGKPVDAIIEHVRDGCTVRAFLLPSFHYVTVMLSGIKCPMFKVEGDQQIPDAFAQEARYFTESRLLQREVQIILEGVSNQNLLGTVMHPNGNITELLLAQGFARCVDWSMGVVSQGPEKLRSLEKEAKEGKVKVWKDYQPSAPTVDIKDKHIQGKVVEIVNGDALVIKTADNQYKKVFLASIRPPRPPTEAGDAEEKKVSNKRLRPLYDIPYMFEAREFLRKKLIGKKINVQVDYVQPPSQGFPERSCATVTIGGINVGEALISKGLATVVKYRQDDDQRSSQYDILLAAEARAIKKGVGQHSKKEAPIHRVADISGDVPKAKQFLPFLQRAGRSEAVVEFVASGSRVRLFMPRETCLVTFLVSGIDCPRASRPNPSGNGVIPSDPCGEEALAHTKDLCLQKEVEAEVETIDKGGNFIGWLYVDGVNLSTSLVADGLAKVHFTAERSVHYRTLKDAEDIAKEKRINLWKNYVEEPAEILPADEPVERKVNYQNIIISEITPEIHFYAQNVDSGPQFEKLMEQLSIEMKSNPPLPGAYIPRKGESCAAKFVDNEWYRARIEKAEGKRISVFYMDYGNREVTQASKLAALPGAFQSLPAQAQHYAVAGATLGGDEDALKDAIHGFRSEVMNKQLLMNVEYKENGIDHVTLLHPDTQRDIGKSLIEDGLLLAENRREKRLAKLMNEYRASQEKAKASRLNLWRYGDITGDDAKEFGYSG